MCRYLYEYVCKQYTTLVHIYLGTTSKTGYIAMLMMKLKFVYRVMDLTNI